MLRKTYTENRKNSFTYACDMKTTLGLCTNEKLDGFGIGAAPPRGWFRFDRLDTFKYVISHYKDATALGLDHPRSRSTGVGDSGSEES